jgi:hypothetical protein
VTVGQLPPNQGLKLPGRLAALALAAPTTYCRSSYPVARRASASKAPARSLNPSR